MQILSEFTIKDLAEKPHKDYANFEGENRVFIVFYTISSEMVNLKKGETFTYNGKIYQIVVRGRSTSYPTSIQLNCLKSS